MLSKNYNEGKLAVFNNEQLENPYEPICFTLKPSTWSKVEEYENAQRETTSTLFNFMWVM